MIGALQTDKKMLAIIEKFTPVPTDYDKTVFLAWYEKS
jgi:hypothetical protein